MRIKVPNINLRGDKHGGTSIDDEDTGESIGQLIFGTGSGRSILLFGEKYRGHFQSHEECVAFAQGVQAVLNHMTSTDKIGK
jgi:hypothetical protein